MSGQIYCPVASLPRDEPTVPTDWETVDFWRFWVQALAPCRIRTQDRAATNVVYIPTTLSPVAKFVCFIALPSAANVTRCTGGWRLFVQQSYSARCGDKRYFDQIAKERKCLKTQRHKLGDPPLQQPWHILAFIPSNVK